MAGNTIELEFGDGQYTFALPLAQINELQRKCGDVGIGALYARVRQGCISLSDDKIALSYDHAQFYALDIIETIRHGLIGGGQGVVNGEEVKVTPLVANRLLDTYVLGQPLSASWATAAVILGACIVGFDPPKKDEPAQEPAPRARKRKKAGSTSR